MGKDRARPADRARGPDGPQPPAASSPAGADPSRVDFYDYVQTSAWIGLVEYLLGQDWAIAQFTADTGIAVPRARSGIEAMIDKATGYDGNREFLRAFLPWVTREHWGEDEIVPGIAGILAKLADRTRDSDGSGEAGQTAKQAGPKATARADRHRPDTATPDPVPERGK